MKLNPKEIKSLNTKVIMNFLLFNMSSYHHQYFSVNKKKKIFCDLFFKLPIRQIKW